MRKNVALVSWSVIMALITAKIVFLLLVLLQLVAAQKTTFFFTKSEVHHPSDDVSEKCGIPSRANDVNDCRTNRCENGGSCVDESNGFYCACALGFTGALCEREIPRTCAHMDDVTKDGRYVIAPELNNTSSVTVQCTFNKTAKITEISNNAESEEEVTCDAKRCFRKTIRYSATKRQVQAIIDASAHCRQFVKYRCKGSVLYQKGVIWGSWYDKNNQLVRHWGGGNKPYYCACGETGTCIDQKFKCNCGQNSVDVTTSDEGWLDDKELLPVKALTFGDAGGKGERAWFTLGKLQCWGKA